MRDLLGMAVDLGHSLVEHVGDGGRIAPDDVRAERLGACSACPLHDAAADSCSSCGCGSIAALSFVGLDLDLKRSWASSECPDVPPRWTSC